MQNYRSKLIAGIAPAALLVAAPAAAEPHHGPQKIWGKGDTTSFTEHGSTYTCQPHHIVEKTKNETTDYRQAPDGTLTVTDQNGTTIVRPDNTVVATNKAGHRIAPPMGDLTAQTLRDAASATGDLCDAGIILRTNLDSYFKKPAIAHKPPSP